MPKSPPRASPTTIAVTAISSDIRPPYTTREKMSRPMLSVPNQYSVDGAALKASLILLGSLTKGRKAANTARKVTSTIQPTDEEEPDLERLADLPADHLPVGAGDGVGGVDVDGGAAAFAEERVLRRGAKRGLGHGGSSGR